MWSPKKILLALAVGTVTGVAIGVVTTLLLPYASTGLMALGVPEAWLGGTSGFLPMMMGLFFGISGGLAAAVSECQSEAKEAWHKRHPEKSVEVKKEVSHVETATPYVEKKGPRPHIMMPEPQGLIAAAAELQR